MKPLAIGNASVKMPASGLAYQGSPQRKKKLALARAGDVQLVLEHVLQRQARAKHLRLRASVVAKMPATMTMAA